jgi:inosine-uridine nucleoside N-ribohydrolase
VKRIHLDTDLGSDTDDLCALAMLLGWPDVAVTGVTTVSDPDGRRAGWTVYAIGLAGRQDVPVEAGAAGSLAGFTIPLAFPAYWPQPVEPRPSLPGAAVDLLVTAAERGDTIVAIGPYTNLALVEAARPGLLATAELVVMGGHVPEPGEGFPKWGPADDTNVQQDAFAAAIVFARCAPVVVPLATTQRVTLRASHLDALRRGGALARLLADQGEAHASDLGRTELGRAFPALPDDLLNFQYDGLACAVAAGWDGATVSELPVATAIREGLLHMWVEPGAPTLRVATDVDGPAFDAAWLDAVLRASEPR